MTVKVVLQRLKKNRLPTN